MMTYKSTALYEAHFMIWWNSFSRRLLVVTPKRSSQICTRIFTRVPDQYRTLKRLQRNPPKNLAVFLSHIETMLYNKLLFWNVLLSPSDQSNCSNVFLNDLCHQFFDCYVMGNEYLIKFVYGHSEFFCLECVIANPFLWFTSRRLSVRYLLLQSHSSTSIL